MITRIYEDKRLIELISCNWKCKLHSTAGISNKKWNNDICQCECKKYCTCKNIIAGILAHVLMKTVSNLKDIVDFH